MPFPLPLLPELIVIHASLVEAVQAQLLDEGVTVTLSVPPLASTFLLAGEIS